VSLPVVLAVVAFTSELKNFVTVCRRININVCSVCTGAIWNDFRERQIAFRDANRTAFVLPSRNLRDVKLARRFDTRKRLNEKSAIDHNLLLKSSLNQRLLSEPAAITFGIA
jgi:hypothetical protein